MLTRRAKQQLVVYLLTSVRSCVVANWTSLSVVCNNVKRNSWGTETICTKVLYSNGKKADLGLIYMLCNEDCPWRLYVLLCALPILFKCTLSMISQVQSITSTVDLSPTVTKINSRGSGTRSYKVILQTSSQNMQVHWSVTEGGQTVIVPINNCVGKPHSNLTHMYILWLGNAMSVMLWIIIKIQTAVCLWRHSIGSTYLIVHHSLVINQFTLIQ